MPRKFACVTLTLAALAVAPALFPAEPPHKGDVTAVRTIRRIEQHPLAWRVWQPFLIQGKRDRDIIVAYGAMTNGKKDMGDIERLAGLMEHLDGIRVDV